MEVKGEKKFSGKGSKTSQEKGVSKKNGKVAVPYTLHVIDLALIIDLMR